MTIIQAETIMLTHSAHQRETCDKTYDHGAAFIDGRYCSIDEAGVPIVDTGFIHADAAYDVVSASRGYIFRLEDHIDRFENSCQKFLLKNPYTRERTAEILANMVRLTGTKDAYIWWCVTRGLMPGGPDRGNPDAYQNRFYAFVIPYLFIAGDQVRERGMTLFISDRYIRIPPNAVDPTAKNFHWMDMKLSAFDAFARGGDTAVLCDSEGVLTESPGANIFLIRNDTLYTPDSGCLEGITRKTVLELAEEIELPAVVGPVQADQLRSADEAFITSTAGGIMPVASVDGLSLKAGSHPGQLTTRLHNLYWEKRWDGWLGTPVDYRTPMDGFMETGG